MLLKQMKGWIPGIRVGFSSFALLGEEGNRQLSRILNYASDCGYYVLLDAPEIWSAEAAELVVRQTWGDDALFPCDGVLIGCYLGSDIYKPFLPFCEKNKIPITYYLKPNCKHHPHSLEDISSIITFCENDV